MNPIKYVDNSEGYRYGENQKKWNPERDYGNEYVRVYFRIDAKHYQYPFGRYDGYEQDCLKFESEVHQIFQALGWNRIPAEYVNACDEVEKGKARLYLHPQNFSGVMLKNEVKQVAEALSQAKGFKLRWVDLYETCFSMNDEEYREYLESQREVIRETLFEQFKTSRRYKFKNTLPICREIAKVIQIHRVEERMSGAVGSSQEERYIQTILEQMVEEGYLVSPTKQNCNHVRSLNKTEQRALKLASL